MKTQKKNGQRLYLQTKNKRWKWMAGATAASVAGVTSAQAGTITINLLNNYISATGGNHLNADLTGDGHPDLTIANAIYYQHYYRTSLYGRTIFRALAAVDLNAVHASAYGNEYPLLYVRLGSQVRGETNPEYFPVSLTGSIPISFNDLHINAGRLTSGSLEAHAATLDAIAPRFAPQLVMMDSATLDAAWK